MSLKGSWQFMIILFLILFVTGIVIGRTLSLQNLILLMGFWFWGLGFVQGMQKPQSFFLTWRGGKILLFAERLTVPWEQETDMLGIWLKLMRNGSILMQLGMMSHLFQMNAHK